MSDELYAGLDLLTINENIDTPIDADELKYNGITKYKCYVISNKVYRLDFDGWMQEEDTVVLYDPIEDEVYVKGMHIKNEDYAWSSFEDLYEGKFCVIDRRPLILSTSNDTFQAYDEDYNIVDVARITDPKGNIIYYTRNGDYAPTLEELGLTLEWGGLILTSNQHGSLITIETVGDREYPNIEASLDMFDWFPFYENDFVELNNNEYICFRCADWGTQTKTDYVIFGINGRVSASGNINSLLADTGFNHITDLTDYSDYTFTKLFRNCTELISTPELPATTLTEGCYQAMFNGCSSLTEVPELPATTLANDCYYAMFYGCSSLISAPELPATELADNCYYGMFYGCTSLIVPPELPATTLAEACYYSMFYNCLSLIEPPELPATTMTDNCYNYMFCNCTSLTEMPELPATALADDCYCAMFKSCESLVNVSELPAIILFDNCYNSMFDGCESLVSPPEIAATTLADDCCHNMFMNCTSLSTAPELNATVLADNCYNSMFDGCSSLLKAPELPATALTIGCYAQMFRNCTSLNEVKCYAEDISATNCTKNWLENVAQSGTFYNYGEIDFSSDGSGIPNTWTEIKPLPTIDDITKPLTFVATADNSTVKLVAHGSPVGEFQTSTNNGRSWSDYTIGTDIDLNANNKISFRAKENRTTAQDSANYFSFELTGDYASIEAWHNIMSLYRTNDYATYKTEIETSTILDPIQNYTFYGMFYASGALKKAPLLPLCAVGQYCYANMFWYSNIESAPELPATTILNNCYTNMFANCINITSTPELPATTLADSCYAYMFNGCSSLNEVKCFATGTINSSKLTNWLNNVSPTGTFYNNGNATFTKNSPSGIPAGWIEIKSLPYKVSTLYSNTAINIIRFLDGYQEEFEFGRNIDLTNETLCLLDAKTPSNNMYYPNNSVEIYDVNNEKITFNVINSNMISECTFASINIPNVQIVNLWDSTTGEKVQAFLYDSTYCILKRDHLNVWYTSAELTTNGYTLTDPKLITGYFTNKGHLDIDNESTKSGSSITLYDYSGSTLATVSGYTKYTPKQYYHNGVWNIVPSNITASTSNDQIVLNVTSGSIQLGAITLLCSNGKKLSE